MKTRLFLILLSLLLLVSSDGYAQGENNLWYFGHCLGLDFTTGSPVFVSDSAKTQEAAATLSDPHGKLMFYSDGASVFDRTHTIMPNGSGMTGHFSATQGAVIAQVAGNDSLYYLFTLTGYGGSAYLHYSIIDMRLNSGLGDVVTTAKNILLDTGISEKMIIAGNCSNKQWLIVHHQDSAIFYAYNLDKGFPAAPVKSYVGSHKIPGGFAVGEMKISRNQSRLALANYFVDPKNQASVDLYDFNLGTGVVSNYQLLSSYGMNRTYGVEFSPDGSKLYVGGTFLYQYDLTLSTIALIRASQYALPSSSWGMRRGPDDMIYFISMDYPDNFSRIKNPNQAKAACNLETNFLPAGSFSTIFYCFGFGNQYLHRPLLSADTMYKLTNIDLCPGASRKIYKPGFTKYYWSDGDSVSSKTITTSGTYWLKATSDCSLSVDTFVVRTIPYSSSSKKTDTAICFKGSAKILAPDSFSTYLWSGGNTGPDTTVYTSTRVIVVATDTQKCRILSNDYTISFINFSSNLKDTFSCNTDSMTLNAAIADTSAFYRWNKGENTAQIKIGPPTSRYVFITLKGCTLVDTVTVKQNLLDVSIGNNKTLCNGEKITLNVDIDDAIYHWSNGATTQSINVSESGKYTVHVTKNGCDANASVAITFVNCDKCVAFPSAFTPNKDGINDYFKPILNCPSTSYEFRIMNRWGQEVFRSLTPNETWDGSNLDGNVYYYMLKIKFEEQGNEEHLYKGDVTLIR